MPRSRDQIYDELLVLRIRDGDRAAFTALVERSQPGLFAHALQLTGRKEIALDAVQETWVELIRHLDRLEDPARFGGFAHRILARRCADQARGQARRGEVMEEYATAAGGLAVGDNAEHASDAQRIRAALGGLPLDRRVAVALHYLHGLSLGEVASLLGIPRGTVKSRLHDARARLRQALQPGAPDGRSRKEARRKA